MSHRAHAAAVLGRVIGAGRSLDAALPAKAHANVRALCFETLRFGPRLEFIAAELLKAPLKPRDADIYALILIGLHEMAAGRTPAYAAVDGCARAARALGKAWAVKLVNAVLRRYQREHEALERAVAADRTAHLNHPAWLLDAFEADWPDAWGSIVEAGNARGPMWLRVNERQLPRYAWLRRLQAAGLTGQPGPYSDAAICLERAVNVSELPGFSKGWVSVQDAGAQLAASLLDPAPSHRVLDACAAPGGKTAHLLELYPGMHSLLAVDRDGRRLKALKANLRRLGLDARVHEGDALQPGPWWDGRPFERILLDAPCTGTGVIRRHPDIKWLKRSQDVEALAAAQQALLQSLWPLLAPGGRLLYVTCSVLRWENEAQVSRFVQQHGDARVVPMAADWGRACAAGRQILPGDGDMDGFYYAALHKAA